MRTITVGDQEVTMDSSILDFGETNLNEFLQKVGGHHAYFAEKHADTVWILGLYEQKYDEIYSQKLRELKGAGPIPIVQAAAKSSPEVIEAHEKMLAAQLNKDLVGGFLKSIDKAFQAAMNYGYNKRKEMDKLQHDIMREDTDERVAAIIAQDSQ